MNEKIPRTEIDGLFTIADSLDAVANAIHALGTGNAHTQMGALELLAKVISEDFDKIAGGTVAHIREHYSNQGVYECSTCHERIEGESLLRDHLDRHNGNARDMDWASVLISAGGRKPYLRNSYTLEEDE